MLESERYLTTLGRIVSYRDFGIGWDVGRDEEERVDLVVLIEGGLLPQADLLMG
jgi:hypothetical protein